jgi:hypothetical protein
VGTWNASPFVAEGNVGELNPLEAWLGLVNSDDQGTNFDLRAELWKNAERVTFGETRCVKSVTRNPANAKKVSVSFGSFPAVAFDGTTDTLSLKILTRIGTNPNGTRCASAHPSALGLRLYFDAVSRGAQFSTEEP